MHMEKLLPQSIEAEIGVLGSIILDPESLPLVTDILSADDFYRESHRILYTTILELYERHEPPDFITLCDELERRGQLEQAGGMISIGSLVNEVPTSGNIQFYGRIVARKAMLRRLIYAAGRIAAIAYEDADADVAVSQAEEMIHRIGQGKRISHISSIDEVMGRYLNKLERLHEQRRKGIVTGVPTGFGVLDRVLGGLQPSDLITLAARPAMGKTSLALNIARHVMEHSYQQGFRVLVFSLEMAEEQLARRLLSMETGIDQTRLRIGDIGDEPLYYQGELYQDEWDLIVKKIDRISEGQMWIDDTPAISLTDIRSRSRRIQTEHGLDLIIVDYMQLMKAFLDNGKQAENRVQEVSLISRGLKELARELNVPVLALAQLSRAVEQRGDKVPQLSDLRESGSIEADSDVVMFIHQDQQNQQQYSDGGYILNIMVAKHRNGPTGVAPLRFLPRLTQFSNLNLEENGGR